MQNNNVKYLEIMKETIGEESFKALIKKLSGAVIRIPKGPEYFDKRKRNVLIKKDYYKNVPVREIAKKYDLSISQVYTIIESRYNY